jgi:pimeloyl-ACP methyl ester carboxylesterase
MRTGGSSEHARDAHHGELEAIARRLTLPVLLVRGKLSDLVTEAEVAEFREMVPHASYVDVAGAAHMIAGDKNDAFTDAVVEFLAAS